VVRGGIAALSLSPTLSVLELHALSVNPCSRGERADCNALQGALQHSLEVRVALVKALIVRAEEDKDRAWIDEAVTGLDAFFFGRFDDLQGNSVAGLPGKWSPYARGSVSCASVVGARKREVGHGKRPGRCGLACLTWG
jgi:hypothetical protein